MGISGASERPGRTRSDKKREVPKKSGDVPEGGGATRQERGLGRSGKPGQPFDLHETGGGKLFGTWSTPPSPGGWEGGGKQPTGPGRPPSDGSLAWKSAGNPAGDAAKLRKEVVGGLGGELPGRESLYSNARKAVGEFAKEIANTIVERGIEIPGRPENATPDQSKRASYLFDCVSSSPGEWQSKPTAEVLPLPQWRESYRAHPESITSIQLIDVFAFVRPNTGQRFVVVEPCQAGETLTDKVKRIFGDVGDIAIETAKACFDALIGVPVTWLLDPPKNMTQVAFYVVGLNEFGKS